MPFIVFAVAAVFCTFSSSSVHIHFLSVHVAFHVAAKQKFPHAQGQSNEGATEFVLPFLVIDLGNSHSSSHVQCEQSYCCWAAEEHKLQWVSQQIVYNDVLIKERNHIDSLLCQHTTIYFWTIQSMFQMLSGILTALIGSCDDLHVQRCWILSHQWRQYDLRCRVPI